MGIREELCALWEGKSCGKYPLPWGGDAPAWRIFSIVCSVPATLSVVSLFFAPESPKWLSNAGRTKEAEAILRRMIASNTGKKGVSGGGADFSLTDEPRVLSSAHGSSKGLFNGIRRVLASTTALFVGDSRRPTIVLSGVWAFLSFGFYGLTLWLPNYFQHGGLDSETNIYLISFYVALANLPGNIFAYYATDYLGRKVTLLVSMLASAGSIFSILKIHSTTGTTVFSCVFAGVSVAGWNSLNILSAENFATRKRAAAFGFLAAVGRVGAILGNVAFGEMSESSPTLPLILTGSAMATGAVLALLLRETRDLQIK